MAIAYKGFELWLCDASTKDNIKKLGEFTFTIATQTSQIGNFNFTPLQEASEIINGAVPEKSRIKSVCVYSQPERLSSLQQLFPQVIGIKSEEVTTTGTAYKAINPSTGYYATTDAIYAGYSGGIWTHYDSDDVVVGVTYWILDAQTTAPFLGVFDFDGEIKPGDRGSFYRNLGLSDRVDEYVNANVYPVTFTKPLADWFNTITEEIRDSDPYSGLDGEGGLPGSGTVGIPGLPGITATSTGIIGLFAPTPTQMHQLADYMWTDFGGQGVDIVDILKELVQAFKRSIADPLNYIIGLNIIPSQGLSVGAAKEVRFGFTGSGVMMPVLSHQYFTVDCGELFFDTVCGDTFLDYAPYSKFSIYLPYIGVKSVDANDFVGHTIGVTYHGDTVTGGITAYVTKDGSVMYQFSGSCALNIPLSSDNWGNTLSAAVQIATSIAATPASAGVAGIGKAEAMAAASVAANPSMLSPQVSHSGAVSGSAGCMGVQYPFVIREAVRFHSTERFNEVTGYPSYYFRRLSDVSGYTKVLDVHLHNIPALADEIAEIEEKLKEGVII